MTIPHAHDEQMLRVGDIDLCVQAFGDPTTPAMLLVHGAEASMDWWEDDFCARLAAGGRHVIRYDARDTGRSTTFPPGRPSYGGDALITDAVGVLDGLGVAPAHIVGMSMGGGIAQHLAVRYPERVASLTLIASTPDGRDSQSRRQLPPMSDELAQKFAQAADDTPVWNDREAVIAYYIDGERMLAGTIPVDEARMRGIVGRSWDRSPSPASAQNHWRLDSGEPLDDRLGRITVPTLVLHGTADPLFPYAHGEALAEEIPGARIVPLEGMGHQTPPPELWDIAVAEILAISESPRR